MGRPKLPENRAVLEAKFENVNRLLQRSGDLIVTARRALDEFEESRPDVQDFKLGVLRNAILKMAEFTVDLSLIETELEDAKRERGTDHIAIVNDWLGEVSAFVTFSEMNLPSARNVKWLRRFFEALVNLLDDNLEPARRVHNKLMHLLNLAGRETIPTDRQVRQKTRDDRIHYLSKLHRTKSPTKLRNYARSDPVLKEYLELTDHIIRNVISPRPRRPKGGISASPKTPCKYHG